MMVPNVGVYPFVNPALLPEQTVQLERALALLQPLQAPLKVGGPLTEEELKVLRERAVHQLLNTGLAGSNTLWNCVIPEYLIEDHAGATTCVALYVDKTVPGALPVTAVYYMWDLPSLTHIHCEETATLFFRILRDEKVRDVAKRALACMERLDLDVNDIYALAEAHVNKLSVDELNNLLTPPPLDYSQYLRSGQLANTTTQTQPQKLIGQHDAMMYGRPAVFSPSSYGSSTGIANPQPSTVEWYTTSNGTGLLATTNTQALQSTLTLTERMENE